MNESSVRVVLDSSPPIHPSDPSSLVKVTNDWNVAGSNRHSSVLILFNLSAELPLLLNMPSCFSALQCLVSGSPMILVLLLPFSQILHKFCCPVCLYPIFSSQSSVLDPPVTLIIICISHCGLCCAVVTNESWNLRDGTHNSGLFLTIFSHSPPQPLSPPWRKIPSQWPTFNLLQSQNIPWITPLLTEMALPSPCSSSLQDKSRPSAMTHKALRDQCTAVFSSFISYHMVLPWCTLLPSLTPAFLQFLEHTSDFLLWTCLLFHKYSFSTSVLPGDKGRLCSCRI